MSMLLIAEGSMAQSRAGNEYVAPAFESKAFNCPHCGAYAHQKWLPLHSRHGGGFKSTAAYLAVCDRCSKESYWHGEEKMMVHPRLSTAPLPSPDMPEASAEFYEEARNVLDVSPRAAAALLRSCIEQLLIDLGYEDGNLNAKIGAVVRDGLPERYQKLFDAVRITGNGIHPGLIVSDSREMALGLFELVNRVVDERITQLNKEAAVWEVLPESAKDAVARRDQRSDG